MRHFRILTGTPGMDRDRVKQKIGAFISRLRVGSNQATVCIRTVEEYIPKLCPKKWYVPDSQKDPLLVILAQLPQDRIRQVWQRAFRKAAAEVLREGPDLAIVMMSLSYYRKETYEFYCPAVLKSMYEWVEDLREKQNTLSTGPILTLIDDIYDLYYRLSRPGHVFDIRQLVEDKLEANEGSECARYGKAMALVVQSLVRVLEWRESEIQAAAALGSVWEIPCLTLAIKHPVETVVRLLLGQASIDFGLGRTFPVYLSHPITRPRKKNAETGVWPDFVSEFDEFIRSVRLDAVGDLHITPVMPTAIDEYRFLKDGDKLLPRLAPRWPLPQAVEKLSGGAQNSAAEELLYSAADDHESYDVYEDECLQAIFDPPLDRTGAQLGLPHCNDRTKGMLIGDAEISGMLRTLESLVTLQMANRDHFLVRQCPGLLLYRPLSDEEPKFSGGVRAEIRDRNQLRTCEEPHATYGRPMVFIHAVADIERFFKLNSEAVGGVAHEIKKVAERILASQETYALGQLDMSTLTTVLANPGNPDPFIEQIHTQLFRPESGSISQVDSISPGVTREPLCSALVRQRVRLLACTRLTPDCEWRYAFFETTESPRFDIRGAPDEQTKPIIAVGVFQRLSDSADMRSSAATFAQHHFAALVAAS